jgi:hypothetical protein
MPGVKPGATAGLTSKCPKGCYVIEWRKVPGTEAAAGAELILPMTKAMNKGPRHRNRAVATTARVDPFLNKLYSDLFVTVGSRIEASRVANARRAASTQPGPVAWAGIARPGARRLWAAGRPGGALRASAGVGVWLPLRHKGPRRAACSPFVTRHLSLPQLE